jgi:WD40 repeat protein
MWWLWNLATGEQLFEVTHAESIRHAEFSPDGHALLTLGDRITRVWDATRGALLSPTLQHPDQVIHGSFNPDGTRIVTACADGTVHVWDWRTGEKVLPELRLEGWAAFATFSPDGLRIITGGGDQAIRLASEGGRPGGTWKRWSAAHWHLETLSADHPDDGELFLRCLGWRCRPRAEDARTGSAARAVVERQCDDERAVEVRCKVGVTSSRS